MTTEELKELVSVYPVLDPSMSQKYSGLDEDAKNKFTSAFWKQRDPLFLTDLNERLVEHYNRVAYVNMRFGDFEKGINGWQTDQGKTHIRFGAPKHKYRTRPSISIDAALKGSGVSFNNPSLENDKPYLNASNEVWIYDNFELKFKDEFMRREFTFKRDFHPDNDSKLFFEKLVEILPESYDLDTDGSEFDFPYLITQFMDRVGETRIEIFYGIPPNRVTLYQYDNDIKVKLKRGFFVFDEDWQEVSRNITVTNKALVSVKDRSGKYFKIDRFQAKLASGTHNIAFELLDEYTQNYGRVRDQLDVRSFDKSHIEISDLLLANDIVEDDSSLSVYHFNNLRIIPNLFRTFSLHDPIFIYFEIYNLQKNEDGLTRFNIETILSTVEGHKSSLSKFASSIGKILGLTESKKGDVGTTYEYYGDSKTQRIYSAFQFADAKPGDYKLKVKIMDIYDNASVEKEVALRVF